jgi:two-component sensor histidine kinase
VRLTRAEDPADFAAAVEGRVAALARAHGLLARGRWAGAELHAVAEAEIAPYRGGAQARAALRGPRVILAPDAVQPLSMVLHELATNAAKHGALSTPGGRVDLRWETDPTTGELRLAWAETGGPALRATPTRRGFGSTLIEAAACGQLGGGFSVEWRPEGLRCELRVGARHVTVLRAGAPPPPADRGPGTPAAPLRGRRVLVAEDEPLVALELERALTELGCVVVGPAATLDETLRLANAEGRLDGAVLDVNLGGRAAFPAADLLAGRGVPIVFATGYGDLPGGRVGGGRAALLRKPLARGELEAALGRLIAANAENAA